MKTSPTRRALVVTTVAGTLLPLAVLLPQPAGAAEGRTYYVDNAPGSGCDDDGPGTAPGAPWCTFADANAHAYVPGDRLLLARGAVFAEGLQVEGEGTADAPVTIDAYGTGPRPRIVKNSTDTGLRLTNPSYWTVRNLDIGSTTDGRSDLQYGVRANFTSPGHKGLVLEDLFVHDNRTVGVHIVNNGPYTTTQPVLQGLRVSRVESTHNGHGVLASTNQIVSDLPEVRAPGKVGENAFSDAVFDHLYLHDDDNNSGTATPSQVDVGCPDGLALSNVSHAVITNSVIQDEAACRTLYGTAAVYLGSSRDVLIANNIVTGTPNTKNPDMAAIDHESRTSQVTIRGNYIGENFGGGVEFLAIHGAADWHAEDTVEDNAFADNGVQSNIPYPPDGAIAQLGRDFPVSATVSGNLYHEPFGFLTAKSNGDVSGFTQSGNVALAERGDLYQAAQDFGAPRSTGAWGYVSRTGGGWRPLTWDAHRSAYSSAAGTIDRFTAQPGATTAVARTWKAPRSGSVTIRGFALPDAPGGTASVSVTLNGRPLHAPWTSVGSAGQATNADDVRVRAGDVIRFEAAAGSAPVSWAPAVAYSSEARTGDAAGTWSFSADGDTQGWTGSARVTAAHGKLEVAASGASTELRNPGPLHLNAKKTPALQLTLDNDTAATSGTVTFTTTKGRTGTVPFHINADEPKGLKTAYRSHLVALDASPAWDGTISSLAVTLGGATGRVSIDRIALTAAPAESWDFTDGNDGWTFNPDLSKPSAGRPVGDSSTVVDTDNSQGAFINHSDVAWTNTRMQTFRVTRGSLARLDLWAYRTGAPTGSLFLRVVRLDGGAHGTPKTLYTGSLAPEDVQTTGTMVSVYPNLRDLDPDATYGLQIFAPYQAPGAGTYGIGYNDAGLHPAGGEFYSVDGNGTWHGPEASGKRSLKFRTFAFADGATSAPPDSGFVPARTDSGALVGTSGYEPALLSPGGLRVDAAEHRYVHVRMTNPDNRPTGYLLFTTTADPAFDTPGDAYPPTNEQGLKGIAFSLVPGADATEYVLDMATVPGWKGTVTQLQVQPLNRWSYYLTGPTSTWHGSLDSVTVD